VTKSDTIRTQVFKTSHPLDAISLRLYRCLRIQINGGLGANPTLIVRRKSESNGPSSRGLIDTFSTAWRFDRLGRAEFRLQSLLDSPCFSFEYGSLNHYCPGVLASAACESCQIFFGPVVAVFLRRKLIMTPELSVEIGQIGEPTFVCDLSNRLVRFS